jgi:hypothetical protein
MCENLEFLHSSESSEMGEKNQTNGTLIDVPLKNQSFETGKRALKD